MEWNMMRASNPSTSSSFMYMGNDHNGSSRDHHVLMAMLNSCPLPALRGLEETGYSAARNSVPKRSFYGMFDPQVEAAEMEENVRLSDQCSNSSHVEKKRRLTVEQVRSLELSFEMENKLEPERKMLLARQLGLQPRQVAVWFQNRRARWKTKQLERVYEALKEDFDALLAEKEKLQAEVMRLTAKLEAKNNGNDTIVVNNVKSDHSGEDKMDDQDEHINAKDRIHNSHDHSFCEVEKPNVMQYNIADISDISIHDDDKIEVYSKKLQAIKDLSAACSDVSEVGDAGSPPEQDHPNAAVYSRDSASSIQTHHNHDAIHRSANNNIVVNASLNTSALDNIAAGAGSGSMFNPQQLLHHQIHHAAAFKFEEGVGYFAADDLPYSGWFNEPDDHHDLPLWC